MRLSVEKQSALFSYYVFQQWIIGQLRSNFKIHHRLVELELVKIKPASLGSVFGTAGIVALHRSGRFMELITWFKRLTKLSSARLRVIRSANLFELKKQHAFYIQ